MTSFKPTITFLLYKWRFVIAITMAITILALNGCSKDGIQPTKELYEKYFEQNVLNRDFKVVLATDNGADLTANYDGWLFKLYKNTYFEGPMTATKGNLVFKGTWQSDQSFGKLVINVNEAGAPAAFSFINREWRFTSKDLPLMELAPWGSNAPLVLHMRRQ